MKRNDDHRGDDDSTGAWCPNCGTAGLLLARNLFSALMCEHCHHGFIIIAVKPQGITKSGNLLTPADITTLYRALSAYKVSFVEGGVK
jgi:hypothetical protein